MMLRSSLLFTALSVVVFWFGAGCSVQRSVCRDGAVQRAGCTGMDELNDELAGKSVTVFCRDSSECSGTYIRLDRDSLLLLSSETDAPQSLATGNVGRIVWRDHLGGILTGTFFGAIWGGMVGWVPLPFIIKDGSGGWGMLLVGGGLLGMAVGAVDGAIEGQQYVFSVPPDSSDHVPPP